MFGSGICVWLGRNLTPVPVHSLFDFSLILCLFIDPSRSELQKYSVYQQNLYTIQLRSWANMILGEFKNQFILHVLRDWPMKSGLPNTRCFYFLLICPI